jgi:ribosomal protein L19E
MEGCERRGGMPNTFDSVAELRHRKVRIVRDYGRFDRREARQFYPDVKNGDTKHAEHAKSAHNALFEEDLT